MTWFDIYSALEAELDQDKLRDEQREDERDRQKMQTLEKQKEERDRRLQQELAQNEGNEEAKEVTDSFQLGPRAHKKLLVLVFFKGSIL